MNDQDNESLHCKRLDAAIGGSTRFTPVQRLRVADITAATRRLTLVDLGIEKNYCSSTGENPRDLWGLLRYINMHNDRYNATDESNIRSHRDIFDTEHFLPATSPVHFQTHTHKEASSKSAGTTDCDHHHCSMKYKGITELSLENWESVNTLALRSISLFLGANITSASFAKCFNLTDEMIRTFTANVANLQKLDVSECIKLSDASTRAIVQCCGKTLKAMNVSKCKLLTNDSCRWIGGGSSFDTARIIGPTRSKDTKRVHQLHTAFGCKRLRHLNFSGCTQISDLGVRHLGWGCCHNLNHLNLSGCCRVTDDGLVDALVKVPISHKALPLCHKMQLLNLEGCECVTHHGLLALIRFRNNSMIPKIGKVIEANIFFGFFSPPQWSSANVRPHPGYQATINHNAASQIQKRFRRSRIRNGVYHKPCPRNNLTEAACCLQNGFRCVTRKRKYIFIEHSALLLQKFCKGWLLELRGAQMKKDQTVCNAQLKMSIAMQALTRRSQAMTKWSIVEHAVQQVRLLRFNNLRHVSVVMVQALLHRCVARSRMRSARLHRKKKEESVIKLQSMLRILQSNRRLASLAHEANVSHSSREIASIRIQSLARKSNAYFKSFEPAKKSCLSIQESYRSYIVFSQQRRLDRRKYISQTFAAICIQNYFRGRQIMRWQEIRVHIMAAQVIKNQNAEIEEGHRRAIERCTELLWHQDNNKVQRGKPPIRDPAIDAAIFIQRYIRGKQIMTWQDIRRHIAAAQVLKRQTNEMKEGRRRALDRCTKLWQKGEKEVVQEVAEENLSIERVSTTKDVMKEFERSIVEEVPAIPLLRTKEENSITQRRLLWYFGGQK